MPNKKSFKPNFLLVLELYPLLSKRRKTHLYLAITLTFITAVAELISFSSVIPFLLLITDPKKASNNNFVNSFISFFDLTDVQSLLLPATILFCLATIISCLVKSLNLFLNTRLSALIGSDLSLVAYKAIIFQPYKIHLLRNSSEVVSSLSLYIDQTVLVLSIFFQFLTAFVISIFLIIGLLIVNWKVTLILLFFIATSYLLLSLISKKRLRSNSKFIVEAENIQVKIIQESIGGIRDVLLDYTHDIFINKYKKYDLPRRKLGAQNQVIAKLPRFLFETLGIIILASIAYILSFAAEDSLSAITIVGTFAFGAQRLLPSLQQIFFSWARITGNSGGILNILKICSSSIELQNFKKPLKKFKFERKINIRNLCFEYNASLIPTLKNINLEIKKGEIIGIRGKTGSGKSTLLDIIMGLVEPSSGKLFVDEIDLYSQPNKSKLNSWKFHNTHVAQFIYLKDSTILDNITFGNSKKINNKRLKQCLKFSQLTSFIASLPDGINTIVGERGVRLSGGQRQRIGIARALYRNAEVLFLDEATSALDSETEKSIIDSLSSLPQKITIIMVAHRESSLKYCDKLITIEEGQIKNIETKS